MSPRTTGRPSTSAASKATVPKRKRTRADMVAERVREGQRRAARRPCPRCGADTLVGLDGDTAALQVTVDARAVGPVPELQAFIEHRGVFLARRHGPEVRLERRDVFAVRANPAGVVEHPVVLEHRCEEHPPPPPEPALFDLPPPGYPIGTPMRQRTRPSSERPTS